MKWALIIKNFFSIQKFVGCPALKFSKAYMSSEGKLSCFYLIRSGPSVYVQDKIWVARMEYLRATFCHINKLNLKSQGPDATVFNA
jgi:hypothetical protein